MGIEIERKYLINKDKWAGVTKSKGSNYRQGYILTAPDKTIRIRLTDEGGFITIKGLSVQASRPEFEYSIPVDDAKELLDAFCTSEVSKVRYKIMHGGKTWEVDEFKGANAGLILAEIELKSETEPFDVPDWVDKEVTGDKRYYNSNLSTNPYKNWHPQ